MGHTSQDGQTTTTAKARRTHNPYAAAFLLITSSVYSTSSTTVPGAVLRGPSISSREYVACVDASPFFIDSVVTPGSYGGTGLSESPCRRLMYATVRSWSSSGFPELWSAYMRAI